MVCIYLSISQRQKINDLNASGHNIFSKKSPLRSIGTCVGEGESLLIRVSIKSHCCRFLFFLPFQSPTSMKITLRQLQEGSKLNLGECLKMEYRLCQRFMVRNTLQTDLPGGIS